MIKFKSLAYKNFFLLIFAIFANAHINSNTKKITIMNLAGDTTITVMLGYYNEKANLFNDIIATEVPSNLKKSILSKELRNPPFSVDKDVNDLQKINNILIQKRKDLYGPDVVAKGLKSLFTRFRLREGIVDDIFLKAGQTAPNPTGRFGNPIFGINPAGVQGDWIKYRGEPDLGKKFTTAISDPKVKEVIFKITRVSKFTKGKFFDIEISTK